MGRFAAEPFLPAHSAGFVFDTLECADFSVCCLAGLLEHLQKRRQLSLPACVLHESAFSSRYIQPRLAA
ncbi:uncharacterized [Tachysurus ichikawai]